MGGRPACQQNMILNKLLKKGFSRKVTDWLQKMENGHRDIITNSIKIIDI